MVSFLNPGFELGLPSSLFKPGSTQDRQKTAIQSALDKFRNMRSLPGTQRPTNPPLQSMKTTSGQAKATSQVQNGVINKNDVDNYLGTKLGRMQQELSEKFGIVTFTESGNISTVPTTRPLSTEPLFFTGTGKFTGETQSSFTSKLQDMISQIKTTGGQIGGTIFKSPEGNPDQSLTQGLSNFFNENKQLVTIGLIALGGVILLKKI